MPVLKVKKNGIWEEVSGGSSVEVDASLTQTGQAADAKAVGDALAGKQPVGDYATENYVDSAISAIPTPDVSGQIGAHNTAADAHTDIRDAVAANEAAISVLLNGTDPETIDGVNDLINYVNEHGSEVTGIKADIQTNTGDITELKNKVGNNTVTEQISTAINPLSSEIANKSAVGHKHTKSEITDFPTSMTPSAHNQAASTITAGTFAGQVVANSSGQSYSTYCVRNTRLASSDTNPTVNGQICWTYK